MATVEPGPVVPEMECVFCSACGHSRSAGCYERMPDGRERKRRGRCPGSEPVRYVPVAIPSDQAFLKQWFNWVRGKVRKSFKRDLERVPDTTQRVCARLLQKEFTARWFFKWLKDDLVTKTEAERILGHGLEFKVAKTKHGKPVTHRAVNLTFVNSAYVSPVLGERSDPGSLWRVSDVLAYAGFDYERYFYSVQSHTIDSDRVLRLLGYGPGDYSKLQSLWRQDKLLPYELTEHECPRGRLKVNGSGNKAPPSSCPECSRGLALLLSKKVTLDMQNYPQWDGKANKWQPASPDVVHHVRKMRWNDSQLQPFLRRWQDQNEVYAQPQFIMRPVGPDGRVHGIDAGLLKYAEHIINNEVINDFKHLTRTADMTRMVYNDGVSPEMSDSDSVAFDPDSEEGAPKIVCDVDAVAEFGAVEHRTDITSLLTGAALSAEEQNVVSAIDLMEMAVKEYARSAGVPVQKVHRIRTTALRKLRAASVGSNHADRLADEICERHGCTMDELLGPGVVGAPVLARAELFATLFSEGMSEDDMSSHFGYPRDRVTAAVARGQRVRPQRLAL